MSSTLKALVLGRCRIMHAPYSVASPGLLLLQMKDDISYIPGHYIIVLSEGRQTMVSPAVQGYWFGTYGLGFQVQF